MWRMGYVEKPSHAVMVWRAEIEEQGRAAGAWLGFAGLGPRQVAVRAAQVGLAVRQAWLGSRLAGLARQGSGVDRGSWGLAWLCWAESKAGGAVGAAGARLGFAGLGPRQVGQVGHVGRLAGFQARAGWIGSAGGAARARLGFAGLDPRQVAGRAGQPGLGSALLGWVLGRWQAGQGTGAWLGFAGLGPRQVAVRGGSAGRAGQPGLGSALLGWVQGRWQAARAQLGFSGLGPRQGREARAQLGFAGQGTGARLGFAGLGPRQVVMRCGSAGRAGQPGLGLALLGWVLGRAAGARLGFAGLGPRQAGAAGAQLGFAGLGLRQAAGRAAGARLGFAGLGPRQVAVRGGQGRAAGAWLGFAGLGPREAGRAGQTGSFANLNDQLTFSLKLFNSFGLKKLAKTLEAGEMDAKIVVIGLKDVIKFNDGKEVDQKDNCNVVEEDGDEDKFSDSDLIAEFNGKNSDTFVPALLAKVWLRYWELVSRAAWARLGLAVRMGRLDRWGRLVGKGRADQLVAGSARLGQVGPNPNPASFAILRGISPPWPCSILAIQSKIKARTKFVADSPRRHQWQKFIFDLEALDYTPFPLILSSLQDVGTLSPA
ncbi:hypothetical protein PPACK8108_LOCUS2084 [Phakopsora pachyrhizi]|uniref:Uncharacterized protein n=1 Tax=Phakopsora pachyrhizi TaxID=170000 RepID=A0AAV0AH23_PHAPC|nr:hypothetical protein PPACK8108_LOCUS2084 [Phakopsora pachyrhizi]